MSKRKLIQKLPPYLQNLIEYAYSRHYREYVNLYNSPYMLHINENGDQNKGKILYYIDLGEFRNRIWYGIFCSF